MKNNVNLIKDQAESIRGLVDELEVYAASVNESAARVADKAKEFSVLCDKVSEKQAELIELQAKLEAVKKAYAAFQAVAGGHA